MPTIAEQGLPVVMDTWRGVIAEYADRLPVGPGTPVVSLGEGGTPLVAAQRISELVGAQVPGLGAVAFTPAYYRKYAAALRDRADEGIAVDADGRNTYNVVDVDLAPGVDPRGVMADIDRLLEPYGGLGAYGRADQLSDRVISDELRQNRATGTVVPSFILLVAAFLPRSWFSDRRG